MGELAGELERITVESTSPDGRIHARVHGRLELELRFARRSYERYTEDVLSHQLSRLATVTWTRYHRQYVEVENAFLDWSVQQEDPNDRLFTQRVEQLTVEGVSPAGWVTVRSRALASWEFGLVANALRRLTEPQFVGEALGAAADTIRAYRAGRARLLDEFYDLAGGLPPWRRRVAGGEGNAAEQRGWS